MTVPRGPGKFNDLCEYVRMLAEAKGALVIIAQGRELGSGAACRMPPELLAEMPDTLREIANQIEADLAAPHWPPIE